MRGGHTWATSSARSYPAHFLKNLKYLVCVYIFSIYHNSTMVALVISILAKPVPEALRV